MRTPRNLDHAASLPDRAVALFRLAFGLLIPVYLGMVVAGVHGRFQLGSDDYAHWEIDRWSPVLDFGLIGLVLVVAAIIVLPRGWRILGVAFGAASLAVTAVGIVQWHHRTYLQDDFVSAFSRLHLVGDFQASSLRFNVHDPDNFSGHEAPNAIKRWAVDLPVVQGCQAVAAAVDRWAGPLSAQALSDGRQRCHLQTFYGSFRVTFDYIGGSDGRWVLSARMEATR